MIEKIEKYVIEYYQEEFDAVFEHLIAEGYSCWASKDQLNDFITSTVASTVKRWNEAGIWSSWSSTGGVALIMTSECKTKKGKDIIEVEILVKPTKLNYESATIVKLKSKQKLL